MWIFTKFGFYSVVLAKQGNGEPGQQIDPDRVMVRARSREHLINLKENFGSLASTQIIDSHHTDYRFRFICSKKTWSEVMKYFASGVEYANIKNECSGGVLTNRQYAYALRLGSYV